MHTKNNLKVVVGAGQGPMNREFQVSAKLQRMVHKKSQSNTKVIRYDSPCRSIINKGVIYAGWKKL